MKVNKRLESQSETFEFKIQMDKNSNRRPNDDDGYESQVSQ
jgi:hypothetical protein